MDPEIRVDIQLRVTTPKEEKRLRKRIRKALEKDTAFGGLLLELAKRNCTIENVTTTINPRGWFN